MIVDSGNLMFGHDLRVLVMAFDDLRSPIKLKFAGK